VRTGGVLEGVGCCLLQECVVSVHVLDGLMCSCMSGCVWSGCSQDAVRLGRLHSLSLHQHERLAYSFAVEYIFKHAVFNDNMRTQLNTRNIQEVRFTCRGHELITAMHPTTLEITKDKEITRQGDCIIGVAADFDSAALAQICKTGGAITLTITAGDITETITGTSNSAFDNDKEVVVRMGDFTSSRTLMIGSDKGAVHLRRELVRLLQNPKTVALISITKLDATKKL